MAEGKQATSPEDSFGWAIKTGDLAGVKEYVEKDKMNVNMKGNNGRTPLHWAADYGQVEIMQFLLSKGAKVNEKDSYGITPLLAAVYEDKAKAVELLLKSGADAKIKGPDGLTAKEAATSEAVKKLFK